MKKQFEILIKIQEIDTRMNAFQAQMADIPAALESLDARLREAESAVETAEACLEAARKQYRSLDSDLKSKDSSIKKSQGRLHAIKTNKEYQAMLREIEDMKKASSRIEDEMLAVLDQIETCEADIANKGAVLTAAKQAGDDERRQLESTLADLRQEIALLGKSRASVAENADPELMKILDEVKEQVRDPAVVPVRSAVCDGCNMNIPPQLFNELHRCDSLKFCPFCNRIIYWEKLMDAN